MEEVKFWIPLHIQFCALTAEESFFSRKKKYKLDSPVYNLECENPMNTELRPHYINLRKN